MDPPIQLGVIFGFCWKKIAGLKTMLCLEDPVKMIQIGCSNDTYKLTMHLGVCLL